MLLTGKCHCGNIAFALDWKGGPAGIPARACGCSFCIKHGGVWTSNPDSRLAVTIRDSALTSKYVFGTRTAASFEGEDVESRLARRRRNWIADVRIAPSGA